MKYLIQMKPHTGKFTTGIYTWTIQPMLQHIQQRHKSSFSQQIMKSQFTPRSTEILVTTITTQNNFRLIRPHHTHGTKIDHQSAFYKRFFQKTDNFRQSLNLRAIYFILMMTGIERL